MIGLLKGTILEKTPTQLLLDVGGVGYLVHTSLMTQEKAGPSGTKVSLLIHTLYRENDVSLYGFLEKAEKNVFQKIIKISGIGPKIALSILSRCSPQQFKELIEKGNAAALHRFEGIGKKTAEKIVFELKHAFEKESAFGPPKTPASQTPSTVYQDAVAALINLGYNERKAEEIVQKMYKKNPQATVEGLIKDALQSH